MSIHPDVDTITVGESDFDIVRSTNHSSGGETLTVDTEGTGYDFDGLEGFIGYEEHTEGMSPRDWSNVGTMAVSYNGYTLGDEDISKIDFAKDCERCEGEGERHFLIQTDDEGALREVTVTCAKCKGNGYFDMNPVEYFKKEHGAKVVLPLIVYEHSGITMQVGSVGDYPFDSQGWDTSFVGFIFDTPEGRTQCIGEDANDEEIKNALLGEVKNYASYLEGDITWWSVQDDETNYDEGFGGYVGSHKECEQECFQAMEQAMIARIKEDDERAYWLARDVMTV